MRECSEFQHQDVPESVQIRLVIGPEAAPHDRCAIQCIVQAANQPEPLTETLSVQVTWREGDTAERLREMFHPHGFVEFCKVDHELDWLPDWGDAQEP
jgi:hypothetical protein